MKLGIVLYPIEARYGTMSLSSDDTIPTSKRDSHTYAVEAMAVYQFESTVSYSIQTIMSYHFDGMVSHHFNPIELYHADAKAPYQVKDTYGTLPHSRNGTTPL